MCGILGGKFLSLVKYHMKLLAILFANFLLVSTAHAEDVALDLWTGTIESQQNTLYLKRCDLAQTEYKLVERTPSEALLSKLDVKNLEKGQYLVVTLVAEYRSENEQDILAIDSIEQANIGESCHLDDMLPDA